MSKLPITRALWATLLSSASACVPMGTAVKLQLCHEGQGLPEGAVSGSKLMSSKEGPTRAKWRPPVKPLHRPPGGSLPAGKLFTQQDTDNKSIK